MKTKLNCTSQVIRKLSHSEYPNVRLMLDEDTDLYELLGKMYQDSGVKFEVTIEEVAYFDDDKW